MNESSEIRTLRIRYGHVNHEVRMSEAKLKQYDHYHCQGDWNDAARDGQHS